MIIMYMTKAMAEHEKFIEERMEKLDAEGLARLFSYHEARMRDFQHERLIHLIVTSLVAVVTILMVLASIITHEWMLFIADFLLFPLLLAYLVHYRSLENGVQSLYTLTKQLGKRVLETIPSKISE